VEFENFSRYTSNGTYPKCIAAMTIERVREFYNAQPFRPFVIHLADRRDIAVHHPDFLAAAPSGRTIVVYQPDDTMNVIDLLLVTDLEISGRTNGARRRRRGS
jgi:hypothetical protein